MFAIIVTGKEAPSTIPDRPMAKEGERFWVCNEPGGWVAATGRGFTSGEGVPNDVKSFKTREAAETFACGWRGHPWWVRPKSWEIVELKPVYRQVLDHFEVV